jgi:dihydrofolate reductase
VTVPVAIIAAVAENGVIGSGTDLPWRLPSDFAFFKRTTMGKPLIMGRKTFESIGKPLPGRTNIVVTRQQGYQPDGVIVIDSLQAALAHAQAIAEADGAKEVMIGGGGEIYRAAMPLAERLYITHVKAAPAGDTTFPAIDPVLWTVVDRINLASSPQDSAEFCVKIYAKHRAAAR